MANQISCRCRFWVGLGFVAAVMFTSDSYLAAQGKGKNPKKIQKAGPPPAFRPLPVSGTKLGAHELAKTIDQDVRHRLESEKVQPSPRSDDAEFLRRVYLDIVGQIPPREKVVEFLASTDPNKRAKVIDELLADPRFGQHLGEIWAGLMLPTNSNNRFISRKALQAWLADRFNKNTHLDKLVYDLVTATGPANENAAVAYFLGNPTVDKITDNVTRTFMGVRLQCAQCHNHPFVEIKQKDYWGMAGFFMKVRTGNPKQAAKKGNSPGVFETIGGGRPKINALPESAKNLPAKFLGGEAPTMNYKEPYRPVLARWITSPNNPYFARAMVNRAWYQFFGKGIVNPVDDMHDGNPPSHPELLALLTQQFKAGGFDLKYLYRAIANSETYQRTSRPTGNNKGDNELYSHAAVRSLSPEQLYDSLVVVLGRERPGKQPGKKKQAAKRGPGTPRDAFLNFFRIDEGMDPLEYQAGIPQALRLMNAQQLAGTAALNHILQETKNPPQVIENIFLTTVSRRPTPQEMQRFTEYVSRQATPQAGYGDILWALLNSSEFALNH